MYVDDLFMVDADADVMAYGDTEADADTYCAADCRQTMFLKRMILEDGHAIGIN